LKCEAVSLGEYLLTFVRTVTPSNSGSSNTHYRSFVRPSIHPSSLCLYSHSCNSEKVWQRTLG
jgi:hypothetical protein